MAVKRCKADKVRRESKDHLAPGTTTNLPTKFFAMKSVCARWNSDSG
jgi:hypothetical protein